MPAVEWGKKRAGTRKVQIADVVVTRPSSSYAEEKVNGTSNFEEGTMNIVIYKVTRRKRTRKRRKARHALVNYDEAVWYECFCLCIAISHLFLFLFLWLHFLAIPFYFPCGWQLFSLSKVDFLSNSFICIYLYKQFFSCAYYKWIWLALFLLISYYQCLNWRFVDDSDSLNTFYEIIILKKRTRFC